ncbi:LEA type 2 family protein [Bacteriovoracales bacterium]|nr:LEA type 2 family protein [Bacteriovoracales bacterium]
MSKLSYLKMLFFSLIISSCGYFLVLTTDIESPKVKYIDHKIKKLTKDDVQVDVNLLAHNPNPIGLKNVFVNYELYMEGKKFFKGENISLALAPKKETKIKLPVKIMYKGIFKSLGPIYKKLVGKAKSLPVEIRAHVYGKPTVYNKYHGGKLFSFNHNEKKIIQIPIPREKMQKKFDKAKDKLKKKAKEALKNLF